MDDLAGFVVMLMVCLLPVLLLGGMVWLIAKLADGSGNRRVNDLEQWSQHLIGENSRLTERLATLEKRVAGLEAAGAFAAPRAEALALERSDARQVEAVPAQPGEPAEVREVVSPQLRGPTTETFGGVSPAEAAGEVPVREPAAAFSAGASAPAAGASPAAAGSTAAGASPVVAPTPIGGVRVGPLRAALAAGASQASGERDTVHDEPVTASQASWGDAASAFAPSSKGASDATAADTLPGTGAASPASVATQPAHPTSASPTASAGAAPAMAAMAGAAPAAASPVGGGGAPAAPAGGTPAAPSGGGGAPPASGGIDWEQWIGVRGAAALGAIILVISGLFFFQYSIEHNWITPLMRVIFGTLLGLGCVVGSDLKLRKTHEVLAQWLSGAGIAILYISFWAGSALYHLYPNEVAGVLLIAVTAACALLAVRRDAIPIAVLGLLGGFATPIALSEGHDRPYALFSYLLLLDAAMLWVAYKRRWPWMGLISLLATAVYQNAWLVENLDEPRLILGVGIVTVFTILFTLIPRQATDDRDDHPLWKLTRAVAVILPLLFTVPLAIREDLGDTFWTTAAQLVLLSMASIFVGYRNRTSVIPIAAALIGSGSLVGWSLSRTPTHATGVWQLVGLGLALLVVFLAGSEIVRAVERRRGAEPLPFSDLPPAVLAFALLAIGVVAAPLLPSAGPWPWLLMAVLSLATVTRVSAFGGRHWLEPAAAGLAAFGLAVLYLAQSGQPGFPNGTLMMGLLVLFALFTQVSAVLPFRDAIGRAAGDYSSVIAIIVLVFFAPSVVRDVSVPSYVFYGGTLLLAALGLFAAARRGRGLVALAILGVTALAHTIWVYRRPYGPFEAYELGMLTGAVLLFAYYPVIAARRLREDAWTWRAAALAGPLYLLGMRHAYLEVLGASTIAVLPIALALVTLGAAALARVRGPSSADVLRTALVWFSVAASGFVTVAIPLQLENEWLTIGWALEALALTFLWRRYDHAGLKYLAMALASVVSIRLLMNPYVLDYYPRSSMRVFNWISYTYLIPTASLVGMWFLLKRDEVTRRRGWEKAIYPTTHAALANACATAAILVLFIWVNLMVFDWFAPGRDLVVGFERLPARDLTLSIAWGVYALGMLAVGMWRDSTALRIASLALILVTCGKTFLYDVAILADLYRVASLAGLAISLIVISVAYRRFVFRKENKSPSDAPTPGEASS